LKNKLIKLFAGLDEAANAEKAGLAEVRVKHPSYDFNTLNEMAQMKH